MRIADREGEELIEKRNAMSDDKAMEKGAAATEGGTPSPAKDDGLVGVKEGETAGGAGARGTETKASSDPTDKPSKADDGGPEKVTSDVAPPPKKTPVKNWPLRDVKEPHDNDVLYGRGGGTNHHPGNKRYRKLVEEKKIDYVNSKRLDKPLVALEIIRKWRAQDPPGRFLKLDEKTGLWSDVGDKKAREKTSQALREKAPLLRKQQEEELLGEAAGATDSVKKSTRFAEGTSDGTPKKKDPKNLNRLLLARDHSLGVDYIQPNEKVSLQGFNWSDPVVEIYGDSKSEVKVNDPSKRYASSSHPPQDRSSSWGRIGSDSYSGGRTDSYGGREHSLSNNPLKNASVGQPARNSFNEPSPSPTGRRSSSDFWKEPPPMPPAPTAGYRPSSTAPPPPVPPPSNRRQPRFLSNEGSSAFARTPSGSFADDSRIRRTSSNASPMEMDSGRGHRRSSSADDQDRYRKHSKDYTVDPNVASRWSGHSEDFAKVASMMGGASSADDEKVARTWSSGSGGGQQPQQYKSYPPPPGHIIDSGPNDNCRTSSSASYGSYGPHPPPLPADPPSAPSFSRASSGSSQGHVGYSRSGAAPPHSHAKRPAENGYGKPPRGSPPRAGGSAAAAGGPAWAPPPSNAPNASSGGLRRKLMGPLPSDRPMSVPAGASQQQTKRDRSSSDPPKASLPRPNAVKRATSNQNESQETKKDLKMVRRAPLMRDHSLAANYLDSASGLSDSLDISKDVFDSNSEMKKLENSMERSRLLEDSRDEDAAKVKEGVRRSKPMEAVDPMSSIDAIALDMAKPGALSDEQRSETLDAFAFELEGDPIVKPEGFATDGRKSTMEAIADDLDQHPIAKPSSLDASGRLNTMDAITVVLDSKPDELSTRPPRPLPMKAGGRLSTMDAITQALDESDENHAPKPSPLAAGGRLSTMDAITLALDHKPDALSEDDQLTSIDGLDLSLPKDPNAWLNEAPE